MALGRAVANLIDNAFSYGSAPVVVRLRQQQENVRFEIWDQGSGMTMEDGALRLTFGRTGDGLRARDGGPLTFFEIAGCYKRYHCPVSRTAFLGTPPQRFVDVEKAVVEGIEAGLEMAKPGNLCEDIAIAFCFAVWMRRWAIERSRVAIAFVL